MVQQHLLKHLLTLAFGAVCISFAPIFVKMLDADVLGPTAIGFWRTFLGAGVLFIWAVLQKESLRLPRPVMLFAALAGFFFCWDLFVWHRSVFIAGAGIATILGNSQVFWLGLIGIIIFKERLTIPFMIALVLGLTGVVLLVGIGSFEQFSDRYISGIIYGLLTGIFYALYVTTLKKAGHHEKPVGFIALMAWASMFTSLALLVVMFFEEGVQLPPDTYSWVVLFGLGFVAQALGWWVISKSLPHLKAQQSGMVLLLQPTLATVWGALFFAEHLTILQVIGAVVTLFAIYLGSLWKK